MYYDTPRLSGPTCTAFSNLSKKKPATFLFGMCPHDSHPEHCLCSPSHMLSHILMSSLHETRQAKASWSSCVMLNRQFYSSHLFIRGGGGGTRWRSWLRHCATSRKVAGSIPDGDIGVFHSQNPSGRSMALVLTQPLKEMSTRNMSRGVGLTSLPPSCADCLEIWEPQPPGTLRACPGL